MFSTYRPEDVTILLKDITGMVEPQSTEEREKLIQSGRHYCEMLPIEYVPSKEYMDLFYESLKNYSKITADAVMDMAKVIYSFKGRDVVLVSLARAGTPIGILAKHYLDRAYHMNVPHYTISIIRGKGIDKNAMDYILSRHDAKNIQFIDGWTGKGAIKRQLDEAMKDYPDVDPGVAVLSDPARKASIFGTHNDFLIPSSLLNSTVSGLLSRTFLRDDIIGPNDFHGAVFYKELMNEDLTYTFINEVEKYFDFVTYNAKYISRPCKVTVDKELANISNEFGISDINLVKPSVGETTRVLLRRVPYKILVHSLDDPNLAHIYRLAKEKNVPVEKYPLYNYSACGLIKELGDV